MLTKVAMADSFTAWCITSRRLVDDVARMAVDCGSAMTAKAFEEVEAGAWVVGESLADTVAVVDVNSLPSS